MTVAAYNHLSHLLTSGLNDSFVKGDVAMTHIWVLVTGRIPFVSSNRIKENSKQ